MAIGSVYLGQIYVLLFATALSVVGCAKPYDPFTIPAAEISERTASIVMHPVGVHSLIMTPEERLEVFEAPATRRLEEAGFRVIPSQRWEATWNRAARDVGGVYDPSTGAANDEKFALVRETVLRDLETEDQVDAIFYIRLQSESVYRLNSSTLWFCGERLPIYFPEKQAKPVFPPESTLVNGYCLSGSLYDLEDRHLYGIRHGLEMYETFAEQTHAVRPLEERLLDLEMIGNAIEAVVGPFADGIEATRAD